MFSCPACGGTLQEAHVAYPAAVSHGVYCPACQRGFTRHAAGPVPDAALRRQAYDGYVAMLAPPPPDFSHPFTV